MKILIVTNLYPIDTSDKTIPLAIEDFARALKDFGCEITVFRADFLLNTLIRKHKIYKNGTYYSNNIKIYNKNFILPFLDLNKSIKHFAKDILKPQNFDVIISHLPSGHIYSFLLNKELNIPRIAIIHQSDRTVLRDIKYKFYFKNLLNKALNSADLKGARNKFLKVEFNADFILPSFVEKEKIINKKSFDKINKKLKIITLSRLIKRKNLNLVIEALSKVAFDFNFDFEYNIYGFGSEKNKLEKLIKKFSKKIDLKNKIKINPPLPHDKIYSKLDENDIFILPSINETFGISYIEALSRGLITVGTKNTGVDGIIQDNVNGFLIEPDTKSIIDVLYKIKNLNTENISLKAIETAQKLSKDNVIKEYLKIINNI